MKFKISRNINRIELHDSTIDEFVITPDFINLIFDWAKLENFEEEKLSSLILGKCSLKLSGIKVNKLESDIESEKKNIVFPNNFPSDLEIISKNHSDNDNHLIISGLIHLENKLVWTNWISEFESFEFSWNHYVTFEQWQNGELPK